MKSATRVAASSLGVYAGMLGMLHGAFEIAQGRVAPETLIVNAIGAPCQPEAVWHACLPAMTVIPSFRITGFLAVAIGLVLVIGSIGFVQRKYGGLDLILLSIALLLVGGGFVSPLIGVIAGGAGATIGAPLRWWRTRVPTLTLRLLAALWPGTLVVLLAWFPGAWLLGGIFPSGMARLSSLLFFVFDLGLPLLTPLTALAHDAHGLGPPTGPRGGLFDRGDWSVLT